MQVHVMEDNVKWWISLFQKEPTIGIGYLLMHHLRDIVIWWILSFQRELMIGIGHFVMLRVEDTNIWWISSQSVKIESVNELNKDIVNPRGGVNLTLPGKGIISYLNMRDARTILILELNEYDVAMKMAIGNSVSSDAENVTAGTSSQTTKDVTAYAENKTSLNDLFDFLRLQERLVIIASSNDTSLMRKEQYTPFLRRFDRVIEY